MTDHRLRFLTALVFLPIWGGLFVSALYEHSTVWASIDTLFIVWNGSVLWRYAPADPQRD